VIASVENTDQDPPGKKRSDRQQSDSLGFLKKFLRFYYNN
jgi:hypothetical protein